VDRLVESNVGLIEPRVDLVEPRVRAALRLLDGRHATLEAAQATAQGRPIELRDLPPAFRQGEPDVEESVGGASRRLSDIEATHLRKALAETRGNKARAARILGLSRWALQRKLQKHRISMQELLS